MSKARPLPQEESLGLKDAFQKLEGTHINAKANAVMFDEDEEDDDAPPPRPLPKIVEVPKPTSPPKVEEEAVAPPAPAKKARPPREKPPPTAKEEKLPDENKPPVAPVNQKTSGSYATPYVTKDGKKKVKWALSQEEDFLRRLREFKAVHLPMHMTDSDYVRQLVEQDMDRVLGEKK